MQVYRVTEEWQRAAIYYVRAQAMCEGFHCPFEKEFEDDTPDYDYVLVMDGEIPASACRIHYLDKTTGKIERVATIESRRRQHFGQAGILEAERWMQEKGVKKVLINSREAAVGFYEKLGYTPNFDQRSGSGDFACIMTEKEL